MGCGFLFLDPSHQVGSQVTRITSETVSLLHNSMDYTSCYNQINIRENMSIKKQESNRCAQNQYRIPLGINKGGNSGQCWNGTEDVWYERPRREK